MLTRYAFSILFLAEKEIKKKTIEIENHCASSAKRTLSGSMQLNFGRGAQVDRVRRASDGLEIKTM
jgi:hypothetical protein